MTCDIQSQLGALIQSIIASGCTSHKDLMININGLSKALAGLEEENISFRQIAMDLAANAFLLAQTDNSVSLTAVKKSSQAFNRRTLKIHTPTFFSDDLYKAGSPMSLMRKHVRSELATAWEMMHGEPLPSDVSPEFSTGELKQLASYISVFDQKGIELDKAGLLYKLCGKDSPVEVNERFRINWILLNYNNFY